MKRALLEKQIRSTSDESVEVSDIDIDNMRLRISANGLIQNDGKFLLVKEHGKQWELPGGGVERGETLKDAMEREVFEETGYRVRQLSSIPLHIEEDVYYSDMQNGLVHSLNIVYSAGLIAKKPDPNAEIEDNVDAIEWLPVTKLDEENSHSVFWPLFKQIQQGRTT